MIFSLLVFILFYLLALGMKVIADNPAEVNQQNILNIHLLNMAPFN